MSEYHRPSTSFSLFPPVLKNLLILNVIFFLAQNVAMMTSSTPLATILNNMALYPMGSASRGGSIFGTVIEVPGFLPWQVITYAFLHGGFGHLFFNLFALWMFGLQLEQDWGSKRFGIFYFACVFGAAVAQLAVTYGMSFSVPTIGASGGVFGVLVAFGMMYPNNYIFVIPFPFPIKAKYFVMGYGALELFSGLARTNTGVAHYAHLGGAVVGFLMILYWRGKLPIKPEGSLLR